SLSFFFFQHFPSPPALPSFPTRRSSDLALTIFGHVEGEIRASTIVIAEGAQIEGKVSAEELTVGGYVKGTLHANRVTLNSTAVVNGDIFHRTLLIAGVMPA